MNNWFKRNSIHFIIAAILIALSYAYFFTPLMQGKALSQSDVRQAQGSQKEIMDTYAKTGHAPLWTNSMFGGMPAYQIWTQFPNNVTGYIIEGMKTIFPNPVDTVLLMLLGAYLLFSVLKLNPWLAAAGAIAITFSSYNFILLDAGHSNQAYAIAFFAPIIAGIILILRGRYWVGGSITAFFLALEIRSNHVQMTYYLMFAVIILLIVELVGAIRSKQLKVFAISLSFLAGATLLAVSVNASMLWTTSEYAAETNRGQSNLTQHTTEPSSGLSKDYAYGWSQGVGECFTFLIPNAYGGSSYIPVDAATSNMTKNLVTNQVPEDQAEGLVQQLGQSGVGTYWGDKPGTSGPYYFGAAVCFLFVLGLLIVRDRIKWWLLGTVVLTMLLSFGHNWPLVSDFFFNHVPMYNKFRTVESILAIAGLCFPILAFLAVQEIINTADKKAVLKKTFLALYITGGLLLVFIILPDAFFSFKTQQHQNLIDGLKQQVFRGNDALANGVAGGLVQDRIAMFRADAIRSLIFVLVAFGILWAYIKQKINLTLASVFFIGVMLIDLWGVDKRYLNDNNFVDKESYDQPFPERDIDKIILRDPDPDYRVLDVSQGNPFTNAGPSYFYKSIGGYHAAKLKRFDELIDNQFSKSTNHDVLDMLNTKYIITADQKTQQPGMQANETACGHAWFVKSVKYVDNADQEMQAISAFDPKAEAIVDKQYKSLIEGKNLAVDPNATITLTSYEPEHLIYKTGATTNQVAVFSEIYYKPGWKFLVDGKEQPYFRTDYLLRAAVIPVGNHTVEFVFHPASYYTGEDISLAGSILLIAALGGAAYAENKKKKPEEKKKKV